MPEDIKELEKRIAELSAKMKAIKKESKEVELAAWGAEYVMDGTPQKNLEFLNKYVDSFTPQGREAALEKILNMSQDLDRMKFRYAEHIDDMERNTQRKLEDINLKIRSRAEALIRKKNFAAQRLLNEASNFIGIMENPSATDVDKSHAADELVRIRNEFKALEQPTDKTKLPQYLLMLDERFEPKKTRGELTIRALERERRDAKKALTQAKDKARYEVLELEKQLREEGNIEDARKVAAQMYVGIRKQQMKDIDREYDKKVGDIVQNPSDYLIAPKHTLKALPAPSGKGVIFANPRFDVYYSTTEDGLNVESVLRNIEVVDRNIDKLKENAVKATRKLKPFIGETAAKLVGEHVKKREELEDILRDLQRPVEACDFPDRIEDFARAAKTYHYTFGVKNAVERNAILDNAMTRCVATNGRSNCFNTRMSVESIKSFLNGSDLTVSKKYSDTMRELSDALQRSVVSCCKQGGNE